MKSVNYFLLISMFFIIIGMIACKNEQSAWKPANGPLLTKWANQLSADAVHQEYPRPQLVRQDWLNLNGLWNYAIINNAAEKPLKFQGKILVPFPVESALSGVMKTVGEKNALWYRKKFTPKKEWVRNNQRILLHFGAVDWETTVWVNDQIAGTHRGGYDAFTFDITDYLIDAPEQEIVVKVWDPVDKGTQPRGKQVSKPKGIWYTSVTGIWQTVWLEPVNITHITSIKTEADINNNTLSLTAQLTKFPDAYTMEAILSFEGKEIDKIRVRNKDFLIFKLAAVHLWHPDTPHLYNIHLKVSNVSGTVLDEVDTYTGIRKISLKKDIEGLMRIHLNDEFVFQIGPLDQGWWPDGLYLAPSDEALKYDIEVTKKLGFNMARKHVKVEPARWYYWCDKLGLMVWQDMPSGDKYIKKAEPDFQRSKASAEQFELELKEILTQFGNHPSIVIWVPFNEGWGQYDTEKIFDYIKTIDPSRLVINTSGWADRGVGDIHDIHAYPGPAMPDPEEKRAIVLGEFGGLGLPLEGHTWQSSDNWGYRNFKNPTELTEAFTDLFQDLHPLIKKGLSAAVYTQTTDVEIEVNGLMTYDRAVIKMDPLTVKKIIEKYTR
jgi:beta-galactosidase/beta-glucuronidase